MAQFVLDYSGWLLCAAVPAMLWLVYKNETRS